MNRTADPVVDQADFRLWNIDAASGFGLLDESSVHLIVTSPPYWQLRDYETEPVSWSDGWDGELGQERTSEDFVSHLADVFDEAKRVMHESGSLWVNLGDTFREGEAMGVPWQFVFAMKRRGWHLRRDIIWKKLGGMPESVEDRCPTEHEYLFHFDQRGKSYFDPDAIAERIANYKGDVAAFRFKRSVWEMPTANYPGAHFAVFPLLLPVTVIQAATSRRVCSECGNPTRRIVNKTVLNRHDLPKEHPEYRPARYDSKKAGSAKSPGAGQRYTQRDTVGWEPSCDCEAADARAVVLDPFMGAGTTALAARELGRMAFGFELDPGSCALADERNTQLLIS